VFGQCQPRHRTREFIKFLRTIDATVDATVDRSFALHLIVDNYGAHKTPAVKTWLAKHPRFHLHFTPTSASWLNLVERFFTEITRDRLRRGVFTCVAALDAAIETYLAEHNKAPYPFIGTKSANAIIAKTRCAKTVLAAASAGNQAFDSEH